MSNGTRTFFAIEIPEHLGRALGRLQGELAALLPDCRMAKSRPFHMTLAFLGDVMDRDLGRVHELVAASVISFAPVDFSLKGVGTFPSARRPRVLWAGASTSAADRLQKIRESVVKSVASVGYRVEVDRFNPHVTLGRFKPGRHGPCDATGVVERYRAWSGGEFTAEDVVGFASRASGTGTTYEVLSRGRLNGQKSPPSA
jgi:2'-5' RNA ligase